MIFPYNSLYTQAVAYATYFELVEPVSRPLFVGSYLLVSWWVHSRTMKKNKECSEWKLHYLQRNKGRSLFPKQHENNVKLKIWDLLWSFMNLHGWVGDKCGIKSCFLLSTILDIFTDEVTVLISFKFQIYLTFLAKKRSSSSFGESPLNLNNGARVVFSKIFAFSIYIYYTLYINLAASRLGKYPPLFTSTSVNNC